MALSARWSPVNRSHSKLLRSKHRHPCNASSKVLVALAIQFFGQSVSKRHDPLRLEHLLHCLFGSEYNASPITHKNRESKLYFNNRRSLPWPSQHPHIAQRATDQVPRWLSNQRHPPTINTSFPALNIEGRLPW